MKDEPHKLTKLATDRYRLISCLAVEDQIIDRMLFSQWFEGEIANLDRVTSKTGWGPLPGGYLAIQQVFPESESIAVDKTAWDWTLPDWVVLVYLVLKITQTGGLTETFVRIVLARFAEVVGPLAVLRTPEGRRFRQLFWGFMKSGWLLTLSLNSVGQISQHLLAWLRLRRDDPPPLVWAMGDDKLMRWLCSLEELEAYVRELSQTGCLVKHALRRREFAGFLFEGNRVEPLYAGKHKYIVAMSKEEELPQLLVSYACLYALSGPSWFDELKEEVAQYVSLSTVKLWAMGLVEMRLLKSLPVQFKP